MTSTCTTPDVLPDMLRRCRTQQQAWARFSIRQRLRFVRAFRQRIVAEHAALAEAVKCDLGKTNEETLGGEIIPLADACRFLEKQAAALLRARCVPNRQRPLWLFGQTDSVYRRPRGVVGVIGTWNYPLFLNGVQIVQALTAGNGVVWKPSEVAPASAEALLRLVREAGFPESLVEALPATRAAGAWLAEADVDHIVFTGSAAVGRTLAAQLGKRLVSSTLELSGCDALIVLDDADITLAARAAWFGVTLNRGQTCIAVRRIFVPQELYPPFIHALRPLAVGAPAVTLALPSAVRQAEELLREAIAEGARPLVDSAAPANGSERRFTPTILLDARPEMAICREASFAPIAAVLPYASLEDVLSWDAQYGYALGASIFTRDSEKAKKLAARLRAGMVAINDVIAPTAHPATPFGGRGQSGWGSTQGAEGLLEMTVPQVVSIRGGSFRPHFDMVKDGGRAQADLLHGMLELTHGRGLTQRWRGLRAVLRAMWRMRR
jgi:acyl-CoA reductase-like NAD-dependent aldehyde dehydrogenase